MRCAACGYEHDRMTRKDELYNDGHEGYSTHGPTLFAKITVPIVYPLDSTMYRELFVCPKCKTVRMM